MAWAVRGRGSQWLAPSVWKGPSARRVLALTFDDGPSESTPRVLELLNKFGAKATFFQCGHHVRRLAGVEEEVVREGHELGNHSDTHEALYLRSPQFIFEQIERAQRSIEQVAGVSPRLFRAPFGARWFGLRSAQATLGLIGMMWTEIARDWTLDGGEVANRLRHKVAPGHIVCFHDGRELQHDPDIGATVEALSRLLPIWAAEGYEFLRGSEVIWNPEATLRSA